MFEWTRFISSAEFSESLSKASDILIEAAAPTHKLFIKSTYYIASKLIVPIVKGKAAIKNTKDTVIEEEVKFLEALDIILSGVSMYYNFAALDEKGNVASETNQAIAVWLNAAALAVHAYSAYRQSEIKEAKKDKKIKDKFNELEIIIDTISQDVMDHKFQLKGIDSSIPAIDKKYKGIFYGSPEYTLHNFDDAATIKYLTEAKDSAQGFALKNNKLTASANIPSISYLPSY